jgi:hypothetical protein
VPVPTVCLTPAFTSGPLGELTLANTSSASCPWPPGQFNSCNALRYDPVNGLWAMPPGFPAPASSSAPLPVIWSQQGGNFSTGISLPASEAIWQPSTSDPAFTTGPSTALNPVTLANPSGTMPSGFVGWAEYYTTAITESSNWWEMWVGLDYPGGLWPQNGNWDGARSLSPLASMVTHLRVRRAVVLTVDAGESTEITAQIGQKNLEYASGGTTAASILGWTWELWGMWCCLDPIAQG